MAVVICKLWWHRHCYCCVAVKRHTILRHLMKASFK